MQESNRLQSSFCAFCGRENSCVHGEKVLTYGLETEPKKLVTVKKIIEF